MAYKIAHCCVQVDDPRLITWDPRTARIEQGDNTDD